MNRNEKGVYQERYARLRAELKAAGEDVNYMEWPNCHLAGLAGARCSGGDECRAPMCHFPCAHCSYEPENGVPVPEPEPPDSLMIEGMDFVGYYLPSVHMVFNSPTRGYEHRFVPVYKRPT